MEKIKQEYRAGEQTEGRAKISRGLREIFEQADSIRIDNHLWIKSPETIEELMASDNYYLTRRVLTYLVQLSQWEDADQELKKERLELVKLLSIKLGWMGQK